MFVTNDIAGIGLPEYYKHQWPLLLALLFALFLVAAIPALSLTLPNLVFG
jgi:TRAP-type C4-dicarboxylate transport system permease large subunit